MLLNGATEWIPGPSMPNPVTDAAWTVTTDMSALIVVGGEVNYEAVDTVYMFSCESQMCSWSLFEQRLQSPKEEAVAFLIPNTLAEALIMPIATFSSPDNTNKLLVMTGKNDGGETQTAEIIDLKNSESSWPQLVNIPLKLQGSNGIYGFIQGV